MNDGEKNDTPRKWYQKAWGGIKKYAGITYKALTSNTGSLISAVVGLGLGVVTGGVAPIALASVILVVKLVKTSIDTIKAIKTRNLDTENKALIDYATALYVKQKTLDLQPKLKIANENLNLGPNNKLSNKERLKHNHSLEIAGKIIGVVNAGFDIAAIALDPLKGVNAIDHIQKSKKIVGGIKKGLEIATTPSDVMSSIDGVVELTNMVAEKLSNHPEIREQLVNLINSERKRDDVGYNNVEELREQTRKMQIENNARIAVMKEDKFYYFSDQEIKNKFQSYSEQIDKETPPIPKQKSTISKLWQGIKDALNPYSKYNPNAELEASKHSGLTMAVRKESEAITVEMKKVKTIIKTKDDININPFRQEDKLQPINLSQRQADIERFKKDSEAINKKMKKLEETAATIGSTLHSNGHSQSYNKYTEHSAIIKNRSTRNDRVV